MDRVLAKFLPIVKMALFGIFFETTLASCGYRWQGCQDAPMASLSIPYVEGDQDGSLTATLIEKVVQSQDFDYRSQGGDWILKVTRIDLSQENIGFRYDRRRRGSLRKEIIPTETRMRMVAEVAVIEASTGSAWLGPVRLMAEEAFDHDYYFSRDSVNIFSLGQLSDIDEAYDVVRVPLQNKLAQKIVDYIKVAW